MKMANEIEESVEIHQEKQLFLKPIARMIILVQLPELKIPGSSISNWEVMEKLKMAICPNLFSYIKVSKTSCEFLHFEAETDTKEMLLKFITELDGKTMKLSGFPEPLRIKAGKAKINYPKKHDWVAFFRDSKIMNESLPGERPDTMHIKGLPLKWFTANSRGTQEKPSMQIIKDIFKTFGPTREIDIPILDQYRLRMELGRDATPDTTGFKTFSFGSTLYFEAFIQFRDYDGFENAMQVFKGKKLLHVLEDGKTAAANLEIDFDHTAHMSEKNTNKRNFLRNKLIKFDQKQKEMAEMQILEEIRQKKIEEEIELQKEEARKRMLNEQKLLREQRKIIKCEKSKVKKIKQKLMQQEKRRHLKMLKREKAKMNLERQKEAMKLIVKVIQNVSEAKRKEQIECETREHELKILQELEEKKTKREDDARKQKQLEAEKKIELETQEQDLRLKLIKNLQDIADANNEKKRELLRKTLGDSNAQLSSAIAVNNSAIN